MQHKLHPAAGKGDSRHEGHIHCVVESVFGKGGRDHHISGSTVGYGRSSTSYFVLPHACLSELASVVREKIHDSSEM